MNGGSSGIDTPPHPGGSPSSSSRSVNGIDLDSLATLTIGSDWCVRPEGQCLDAQSFTVDFTTATLTNTTCVELAGKPDSGAGGTQDGKTSHAIKREQLDTIKQLLANLQTTVYAANDAGAFNNPKRTLQVTSKAGTEHFATYDTACPSPPGTALEAGWNELWDAIRAM